MKGSRVHIDSIVVTKRAPDNGDYAFKKPDQKGWDRAYWNNRGIAIKKGQKLLCIRKEGNASVFVRLDEDGGIKDRVEYRFTVHTQLELMPGSSPSTAARQYKIKELKRKLGVVSKEARIAREQAKNLQKQASEIEAKIAALAKYSSDEEELLALVEEAQELPREEMLEKLKKRISLK